MCGPVSWMVSAIIYPHRFSVILSFWQPVSVEIRLLLVVILLPVYMGVALIVLPVPEIKKTKFLRAYNVGGYKEMSSILADR